MASVIMFHSVGLRRLAWRSPQIAEDVQYFREKLRAIDAAGYESVFFTDPRAHVPPAPEDRTVCLTFDDGYLDNWVHVFPILEELGMKASIFVTPEFVDPRDVLRPRARPDLVDDAGHDPSRCCAGFLSWPEMREMERSGLVEIQSHALTHDFHFSGPRIVDFWRPGAATRPGGPAWMLWNEFREEKPFYLTRARELEDRIPWGTPIYEHGKALEAPRWYPEDGELPERIQSHVADHGGAAFFERPGWRAELADLAARLQGSAPRGHHEPQEEYRSRIAHELAESRRRIEHELGHEVPALVWPGGGVTEEVFGMARDAGYRIFTRPSRRALTPSADSVLVDRVPSICRAHWRGTDLGNLSGREFLWYLRAFEGSRPARLAIAAAKYTRVLAARTGVLRP